MDREQSLALWKKCEAAREEARSEGKSENDAHARARAIWNDWATPLVERRYGLIKTNEYEMKSEEDEDFIAPPRIPCNQVSEQFFRESLVDFRGCRFEKNANFEDFIFPGDVRFGGIQRGLSKRFPNVIFEGASSFGGAQFHGDANFGGCSFEGGTEFRKSTFYNCANFAGVKFKTSASFRYCRFEGQVWFGNCIFASYTEFNKTIFLSDAAFRGSKIDGIFDLTKAEFRNRVPDFQQTVFPESPNLGNVFYRVPDFFDRERIGDVQKYRAIRRLAIQANDHENEARAFKSEVRARRLHLDKPWRLKFWLGILYDVFSNFGRSIATPFLNWLGLAFVSSYFYFSQATSAGMGWRICMSNGGDPLIQALYLSVRNALVIFSNGRDTRQAQAYICLYGGTSDQPMIPAGVTFFETLVQTPLSATLIFLFLLGVRNQFGLK